MTDAVALPTLDSLCAYVKATLCERDALDPGTTPFVRIRGGVENLRLAQQALNRIVPGATGLKKL